MTNFEFIKNMTAEELAKFLNRYSGFDTAPWNKWFDEKYCENCESVKCKYEGDMRNADHEFEAAYCELNCKCRFFLELDHEPSVEEVCVMWLKEEKK